MCECIMNVMTGKEGGAHMTRGRWVLLGALVTAIFVVVYFVFFCPSECH